MLYRSDKISDSIEEWEILIVDFTEYADEQNARKRLSIYQFIYLIQDDVYRIKSVLDSLHKKPGIKTTIKQGMVLEIHTKLSHKINNSELMDEFKRERQEATNDVETQVDLRTEFARTVKTFDGLSEENSEAIVGEVESLINKIDSTLNEYEDWSAKHLSAKSSGFKKRFRKTLNKIHYYRYKTRAWAMQIKEASVDNMDEVKKDLVKTCISFQDSWKKLRDLEPTRGA